MMPEKRTIKSNIPVLLQIIDSAGEKIRGRVTLQKLAYFLKTKGILDYEFKAHYYGPYSEKLAQVIDNLSSAEFINEKMVVLGVQQDSWLRAISGEVKVYRYKLTNDGEAILKSQQSEGAPELDRVKKIVEICKETVELEPQVLASAAKIHFILSQASGKKMARDEIRQTASELGWNLSEAHIEKDFKLLKALNLIKA